MSNEILGKWKKEWAWEWYAGQPQIIGFNYVPSTAVNSTDMWQESTFDEETIRRELSWATRYRFNACRVFIQYIVWKYDSEGLKRRIEKFLEMAQAGGLRTLMVLFDDCKFDDRQPFLGPQLDPIPGVHNSRWTPSPGEQLSGQPEEWVLLEAYVKDVVTRFSRDERVLAWDLYNEPGNCGMGIKSAPLLCAAFRWCREANPMQPVTSGMWDTFSNPCDMACCEQSDIISFHCYYGIEKTEKLIFELKKLGRPLLCTEWLHRIMGSRIQSHLPVFARDKIGIFNWGFVNGKTQTHLSWDTCAPGPAQAIWQHDLLFSNRTPYDAEEMNMLKTFAEKGIILRDGRHD